MPVTGITKKVGLGRSAAYKKVAVAKATMITGQPDLGNNLDVELVLHIDAPSITFEIISLVHCLVPM